VSSLNSTSSILDSTELITPLIFSTRHTRLHSNQIVRNIFAEAFVWASKFYWWNVDIRVSSETSFGTIRNKTLLKYRNREFRCFEQPKQTKDEPKQQEIC
jgi:hypothetical protein